MQPGCLSWPSRVEPFGIVVIEALRSGVSDDRVESCGASEIVSDGEDALCCRSLRLRLRTRHGDSIACSQIEASPRSWAGRAARALPDSTGA